MWVLAFISLVLVDTIYSTFNTMVLTTMVELCVKDIVVLRGSTMNCAVITGLTQIFPENFAMLLWMYFRRVLI